MVTKESTHQDEADVLESLDMIDGDKPRELGECSLEAFDMFSSEPSERPHVPLAGHHGMRAYALHAKAQWREAVVQPAALALQAPLSDKSTIVCRTGMLMLASGTGAWRVRDTMNRVAHVLGITVHVDLSLLSFECTCIEGTQCFSEVVSLSTTGVDTARIWMMEGFLREVETYGRTLSVERYHELLDAIEHAHTKRPLWQQALAAACACAAFVFLLGGGPVEMLGACMGAGVGNGVRSRMLSSGLGQFGALAVAVVVGCVGYLVTLVGLSACGIAAWTHQGGYIGAMLFVIPGFPLITAGLDIAKLDMRSGMERLFYAVTIIMVATLMGWLVAEIAGLKPVEFEALPLSAAALTILRLIMSFVGVFGFSIMFNSSVAMAATAGVIGAVANTLRLSLGDIATLVPQAHLSSSVPPEAAALVGALVAGLLAHVAQQYLSYPRISLTVPSIVIMVPGLYLYRAMYYMCIFDTTRMLDWFIRAVLIVAFLPVGLGVARALTDARWRRSS